MRRCGRASWRVRAPAGWAGLHEEPGFRARPCRSRATIPLDAVAADDATLCRVHRLDRRAADPGDGRLRHRAGLLRAADQGRLLARGAGRQSAGQKPGDQHQRAQPLGRPAVRDGAAAMRPAARAGTCPARRGRDGRVRARARPAAGGAAARRLPRRAGAAGRGSGGDRPRPSPRRRRRLAAAPGDRARRLWPDAVRDRVRRPPRTCRAAGRRC